MKLTKWEDLEVRIDCHPALDLIGAYQPAIQQCFSLITNQHQSESANQKPSSEQMRISSNFVV
jgi:hypothetical protein